MLVVCTLKTKLLGSESSSRFNGVTFIDPIKRSQKKSRHPSHMAFRGLGVFAFFVE